VDIEGIFMLKTYNFPCRVGQTHQFHGLQKRKKCMAILPAFPLLPSFLFQMSNNLITIMSLNLSFIIKAQILKRSGFFVYISACKYFS